MCHQSNMVYDMCHRGCLCCYIQCYIRIFITFRQVTCTRDILFIYPLHLWTREKITMPSRTTKLLSKAVGMPRIVVKHMDLTTPYVQKLAVADTINAQVQHFDQTNETVVRIKQIFRQTEPLKREGLDILIEAYSMSREMNVRSLWRNLSTKRARARALEERLVYVSVELDAMVKAMKRLFKSVVKDIEITQITQTHLDEDKGTCCVCFDDFHVEETVKKCHTCQKCYHDHCLEEWFKTNRSCPSCRLKVSWPGWRPTRSATH